jgi:hypothetical protein
MSSHNIAAIHDRIDEEHFEVRLHASAITALQQRVNILEAAVRELRLAEFGDQTGHVLRRDPPSQVPPLRKVHSRSTGRVHGSRLA